MPRMVLLDTDRIKEYVFGTPKLREIRGASLLLEYLNRVWTPKYLDLLKNRRAPGLERVYSHGGSTMVILPDDLPPEEVIGDIEARYRLKTISGSITGASVPWDDKTGASFKESRDRLIYELRAKKDLRPAETPLSSPFFRFCDSCGSAPAVYRRILRSGRRHPSPGAGSAGRGIRLPHRRVFPEFPREFLCLACQRKRMVFRMRKLSEYWGCFSEEFKKHLTFGLPEDQVEWLPDELGEIGEVSHPNGYLAFVYCDVNNMEGILSSLDSPGSYGKFANGVDKRLSEVTHEVLKKHLPLRKSKGNGKELLPYDVLMLGGDDLILVVAADKGMEVALDIVEGFSNRPVNGNELKLSAAVVIAHADFPIFSFNRLAFDLLKRAKREALRSPGGFEKGGIDFLVVTGSASPSLEHIRSQDLSYQTPGGKEVGLTQRPYPLEKARQLILWTRRFKKEGFPRSRLQYLYESLFQSEDQAKLVYAEVFSRLEQNGRQLLGGFLRDFEVQYLPPWRKEPSGELTTPLLDLVEIMDFV